MKRKYKNETFQPTQISEPNNIPLGFSLSRPWISTDRHETYATILKNYTRKQIQKGTKTPSSTVYILPHWKKQHVLNNQSKGSNPNQNNLAKVDNINTIIISNKYNEANGRSAMKKAFMHIGMDHQNTETNWREMWQKFVEQR